MCSELSWLWLKLKTAKHVSDGIGAFRKEQSPTMKVREDLGLEGYLQLRRSRLEDAARQLAQSELSGGVGDSDQGDEDGEVVEGGIVDVGGDGGGGDVRGSDGND